MASSGTGRGARIARRAPQPEDVAVGSHSNKRDSSGALATLRSQAAPSSGGATLMALQGTAGNGAVARLLRSPHQAIPRGLQAKLMVGAANDPLEREADRVADLVMRTGLSWSASGRADEVDEAPIQRLADAGQDPASAFEADTSVAQRLAARSGGGQPLPPPVRNRMEAGFGADFSQVRIHRDAEAADLSTGLAARAFTHGTDIYFAAGTYEPGSRTGQHLLAHELTHVVQQGGASLHRTSPAAEKAPAAAKQRPATAVRPLLHLQRLAGIKAVCRLLDDDEDAMQAMQDAGYMFHRLERGPGGQAAEVAAANRRDQGLGQVQDPVLEAAGEMFDVEETTFWIPILLKRIDQAEANLAAQEKDLRIRIAKSLRAKMPRSYVEGPGVINKILAAVKQAHPKEFPTKDMFEDYRGKTKRIKQLAQTSFAEKKIEEAASFIPKLDVTPQVEAYVESVRRETSGDITALVKDAGTPTGAENLAAELARRYGRTIDIGKLLDYYRSTYDQTEHNSLGLSYELTSTPLAVHCHTISSGTKITAVSLKRLDAQGDFAVLNDESLRGNGLRQNLTNGIESHAASPRNVVEDIKKGRRRAPRLAKNRPARRI